MKILVITPYPPIRDGIAAYASQQVRQLRRDGHDVRVLSPGPSAAHEHLDLRGSHGALALGKRLRAYDRVIVQYHPDFFHPPDETKPQRAAANLALLAAFRMARHVEVTVHEIDYRHGRLASIDGAAARALWRSVDELVVHTGAEKANLARAFGLNPGRIRVTSHGQHFVPRTAHSRLSARQALGLSPDETVFLSIGFIQPHKGFDRGLRAFQSLDAGPEASFHVVGSLRLDAPEFQAHAEELSALADRSANTALHLGYVSDEAFDRWILAADVIVLPYRNIWSSGVLERARLFGRPIIASAVGGLAEQAADLSDITLVEDDRGLRVALRSMLPERSTTGTDAAQPWPTSLGEDTARDDVQYEVRRRATLQRGGKVPAKASTNRAEKDGFVHAQAASAALRRLQGAHLPPATSARPMSRLVKSVIARLTAWQLAPVVDSVNQLQQATIKALEEMTRSSAPDAD